MALSSIEELLGLPKDDGRDDEDTEETKPDDDGQESKSGDEGDESEPEAKAESDKTQGEPEKAKADDEGDDEPESKADAEPVDEGDEKPKDLARENAGLKKELAKLREERRVWQTQHATTQRQSPQPAPLTTTAPTQESGRIPISFSQDGREAFVAIEHVAPLLRQEAQAEIQRATTPTEAQVRAGLSARMEADFAAEGAQNQRAVTIANEADEFISESIGALQRQGYQFANVYDAIEALKQAGVDRQLSAAYPAIGAMFEEFVEARSVGSHIARRSVLRQIAQASAPAPKPRGQRQNGAKRELGKQPRSMTRKGGARDTVTSDEAEFNTLEREFRNSMAGIGMPKDRYNRYLQLGKSLGKDGLDD